MSIKLPYKRTVRQFMDGKYSEGGRWQYLLDYDFTENPRYYLRSFLLLQEEILELFKYIEPADKNLKTIGLKIHDLLVRTCIEIENNFVAIFNENDFDKKSNFNINDFKKINSSHFLSMYEILIPEWKGENKIRCPFKNWDEKGGTIEWYKLYNKSKHDRYKYFEQVNFEHLIDAFTGLCIVISSQFHGEEFNSSDPVLGISGGYKPFGVSDSFEECTGSYFMVKYPQNIPEQFRYDFDWQLVKKEPNRFQKYNYDNIQGNS